MFYWTLGLLASLSAVVWTELKDRQFSKYKFENRTAGGVVEYESYSHARRQEIKENLVGLVRVLSLLSGALCILAMLVISNTR